MAWREESENSAVAKLKQHSKSPKTFVSSFSTIIMYKGLMEILIGLKKPNKKKIKKRNRRVERWKSLIQLRHTCMRVREKLLHTQLMGRDLAGRVRPCAYRFGMGAEVDSVKPCDSPPPPPLPAVLLLSKLPLSHSRLSVYQAQSLSLPSPRHNLSLKHSELLQGGIPELMLDIKRNRTTPTDKAVRPKVGSIDHLGLEAVPKFQRQLKSVRWSKSWHCDDVYTAAGLLVSRGQESITTRLSDR
ncbi:hypothetical protein LguiA_007073 [Lonicera macranthoides]